MTYTEWRDELKNNLLSTPDSERRRVLEYYAEAYADRREAGFSEAQIIEEFGAPYDAAQRILSGLSDRDAVVDDADVADIKKPDDAEPEKPKKDDNKRKKQPVDKDNGKKESGKNKNRLSRGKRAAIIISAIFGGLFLAAFIYFMAGLAVNDWQLVTKYEQLKYTCKADITKLCVDGTMGNISIEMYDGDKAYVSYPTSKRFYVSVSEKNGILTVNGPDTTFPFWGYTNMPDTVIMLPDGAVCDLDVEVNAGTIKIAGGTFNRCEFDIDAGTLELGRIRCASAEFDIDAGSVSAAGLDCASVKAEISAGDLTARDVTATKIDIDASAGSVELGLSGSKAEYTIFIDSSAGSCNVSEQTGTTDKVIKIDISAGSVTLGFKQ